MNLLKYFTSRDEDLPASYVRNCEKFLKKIKLKKLVRKLNKENEPPGGGKPEDRVQASSIRVTPTGISLISCKDPKPQARKRSSLTRSQA